MILNYSKAAIVIIFYGFSLCATQVVLFPSETRVNLGYFSLALSTTANPTITCDITTATSLQAALTLQSSLSCPRSATNVDWSLVFDPSLEDQRILVMLNTPRTARMAQVLLVACCNIGIASSTIVSVDISQDNPFNLTGIAADAVLYPNPAYENIAPCPCNLTTNMCDVNCCCDTECNVNDFLTFSCILGPFGGNFSVDLIELCGSQEYLRPDWHLFLCTQFLNTPDLGLFYPIDINTANNEFQFSARLAENPFSYTFAKANPGQAIPPVVSYSSGDPVIVTDGTDLTYLYLAQRSLSGECIGDAIVLFQRDADASCDVTVTSAVCRAGSKLDINSYLLQTSTIVGGASTTVTATVTYMCGDSVNYVKTAQAATSSTRPSLFGPNTITPPAVSACSPTAPAVSGTTCQNAVVGVTYTLTWNLGSITAVQADIVAANVPLSDVTGTIPDNILAQSFQVRFQHVTLSLAPAVTSSGNPGYNIGYPVISGSVVNAVIDRTDALRVWQPGSSGLCADSGLMAPPFGRDLTTGCQLRLALSNFNDCASLRQTVEDQQRLMIGTATHVARYGSPTLSDVNNDFLSLNLSTLVVPTQNTTTIPGQCSNILAHAHIQFLISLSGRISGFPIMEIVGVNVSWSDETWQLQCWGTQACDNIGSTTTENFFVTSSVSFTTIPPTGEPKVILADIRDNTTCERDATCWPELWSPLTQVFYYTMPLSIARLEIEYNLVWALFVIMLAAGFFLLQLDWNKIGQYAKQQFPL